MEELVWSADYDTRFPYLKQAVGFAAVVLVPNAIIFLAKAGDVGAGGKLSLLSPFLLVAALIAAGCGWALRQTVRVELAPAARPTEIVVSRANGSTARYPVAALRGVEVTSKDENGYRSMRLRFDGRTERTRDGRARDPRGWSDALTALEVRLTTREAADD